MYLRKIERNMGEIGGKKGENNINILLIKINSGHVWKDIQRMKGNNILGIEMKFAYFTYFNCGTGFPFPYFMVNKYIWGNSF